MLTHFDKPDDSKELYFKLNASLLLVNFESASSAFKYAGIYAIYKDDVCYYVGQSQNLASRLSQHLTGKYECSTRVDCYMVAENGFSDFYNRAKETRKAILELNEMAFIKKLKPLENLITPPSDFDIEEKKSFCCLTDDDEFNCYGFVSVHVNQNSFDVTSGVGPHELTSEAYRHHNDWIGERAKHMEVSENAKS